MADDDEPDVIEGELVEVEEPSAPARKRKAWGKVDWPKLKKEYVEGIPTSAGDGGRDWPTYAEVAARNGSTEASVKQRGAAEGWREARMAYRAHLERVRQQRRAEGNARELEDLDHGALRVAKTGVAIAQSRLVQIGERVQAAKLAGELEAVIDARELNQLAQAADLFHRIGLRSLGAVEGAIRQEITGGGGGAIEIQAELRRDDPARLTGVLHVLHLAGLGDLYGNELDARALLDASAEDDGGEDGGRPALETGG
jgi:hypothetical protein